MDWKENVLFTTVSLWMVFHCPGFYGSGLSGECNDIDECEIHQDETHERHNCDSNADCTDTTGDFTCTCRTGYTGSGVRCRGNKFMETIILWFQK